MGSDKLTVAPRILQNHQQDITTIPQKYYQHPSYKELKNGLLD